MLSGIHSQDGTFLTGLNQIQSRISKNQQQITSGIRVSKASDDAGAVSPILSYQAQIDHLTQTGTNLTLATADASAADSALQSATNILDQISSIAAQSLSLGADPAARTTMGQQVQALEQQLVSVANTSVRGYYIFGGDNPGAPPYAYDASSPNGIVHTNASASTRLLTDGNGSTRLASLTAGQIFDTRTAGANGNAVLTDAALTTTPALDSTANPGIAQSFQFTIQGQAAPLTVTVPGIAGGYTTKASLLTAVQTAVDTTLAAGSPALPAASIIASVDSNNHLQFKTASAPFTMVDNGATDTANDSPAGITSSGNPAPDNIFAAAGFLAVSLLSNNTGNIQTAITALKIGANHLQSSNAFYGNVENWITNANASASSQIANLHGFLSNLQDTDLATAITQMTADNTGLQAAISAHASLSNKTLFDYLG